MKDMLGPSQEREKRETRTRRDQLGTSTLLFPKSRLLDVASTSAGVAVDALRLVDQGLTLGRVISGGHEVALEDPDFITLLLPKRGRIAMWTGTGDLGIENGSLVMVLAEKRRTRVIPSLEGLFVATTVHVPRSRLVALGAAHPRLSQLRSGLAARPISTASGRGIGSLLSGLADDIFRQPSRLLTARALQELVSLIDDLLVDDLGQARAEVRPGGGLREFQRVSRACDMIEARADEALSIATIAAELEVTPRSLQIGFQAVHGISPRQYLNRVRLERARRQILAQGESASVTTVAFDCGFLHLGRFAQAYRRAFGELPSTTQARPLHVSGRTVSHSG